MSSTAPALRARVPRLAGAALERARLTVVPKRRRRQQSSVPFLVVVSMLAVGGIVGLLLFNTSMQQASFAATDLQHEADTLTARQQTLQMELDRLRDPQVIAQKAQRLGMVLPSSPAVLDLRTGKILGDPTPANRLEPLRLVAPPPVKPAELDPPANVTIVHDPASTPSAHDSSGNSSSNSSSNTASGSQQTGPGRGRQDHTRHNDIASNTSHTGSH